MSDYSPKQIEQFTDEELAAEITALKDQIEERRLDIEILKDEIDEFEQQLQPLTDEQDERELAAEFPDEQDELSTPAAA
jgi:TolA-binding protein